MFACARVHLCVSLIGMAIFMVKATSKGNLSLNSTLGETVKIKHGGPGGMLSVLRYDR